MERVMKRTLMLKNQELFDFEIDTATEKIRILDAPEPGDALLASLGFDGPDGKDAVAGVVKQRHISSGRDDIDQIRDAFGVQSVQELTFRGHGLSLSDKLWYRAPGSFERWEDINFFDNDWDGAFCKAVLTDDYGNKKTIEFRITPDNQLRVMPMKLLRIKDNSQYKRDSFDEIKNLTGKIADKTLEQLEREGVFVFPEFVIDADDITKEQMILQSINDSYRAGNVMGFLGCGDERLIIESRFCSDDEDYFFQYLLDRVLDFPNIVDLKSDADQNNRLFNFLLFLFPYYLKTAMRKGLFKKYVCNRYNDKNVKGTIDIARHIGKNTPFIGNVAYSQREFSYDNNLMELVRHTIEYIKKKPYGNNLLLKVKDEVKLD